MTTMAQILRQEIQSRGPIPFARFMEVALYTPGTGYYERPEEVIGRSGDFFTSVSVGNLFGRLLAFQWAQWLKEWPSDPLVLVEAGAHRGHFAKDVLTWFSEHEPALLERLEYWIVEPSSTRRTQQQELLRRFFPRVRWCASLVDLPGAGVTGIIFSNELLDAMPVRRFGWDRAGARWFEWGVGIREDAFIWERLTVLPPAAESLFEQGGLAVPAELRPHLPDQFTMEVCPAAAAWWQEAARALRHGKLLTIDYGLTADEFISPQRADGTVRSYYRHHLSPDLLARPGEQDLTAHVNFSQLQQTGEATGLKTDGCLSQSQFLTGLARQAWEAPGGFGAWSTTDARQFQTLTHPEHLGRSFRVLWQSR